MNEARRDDGLGFNQWHRPMQQTEQSEGSLKNTLTLLLPATQSALRESGMPNWRLSPQCRLFPFPFPNIWPPSALLSNAEQWVISFPAPCDFIGATNDSPSQTLSTQNSLPAPKLYYFIFKFYIAFLQRFFHDFQREVTGSTIRCLVSQQIWLTKEKLKLTLHVWPVIKRTRERNDMFVSLLVFLSDTCAHITWQWHAPSKDKQQIA